MRARALHEVAKRLPAFAHRRAKAILPGASGCDASVTDPAAIIALHCGPLMEYSRTTATVAKEARRVSTGDAGLDRVLCGGLFRGAVTIIQGPPGAGKTTLANQMAFENSRRGGNTVYITLLAESHGRLTASLGGMDFFVDTDVGQSIHYVSGYNILFDEGTRGLLRLLGSEAKARQANVVVLDGLFVLGETMSSENDYRKFVNDLALQAELMGCTVLLLTNGQRCASSPEYTMVDGWIEVGRQSGSSRTSRFVEVHKLRGSDFLPGRHRLQISERGARTLPRLESYLGQTPQSMVRMPRLSTGVAGLDRILEGGLPARSTTLLWGPTGIGKTTLGLHFVSDCTPAEPGLIFTFYESPDVLVDLARQRGVELAPLVESGALHILWHPPTEHDLDELGYSLLEHVQAHGTRRLVLDAIDAFEKVAVEPERLGRFLNALTNELRGVGCTSVYISETNAVLGNEPHLLDGNRSAIGQNILMLRYAQAGARLARTLTVLKVRESDFDRRAHEFRITARGVEIEDPMDPRSRPVATMPDDAGREG
jgi:circadian clock protein KaiC